MKEHLLQAWLAARRGVPTVNDEGNPKSRHRYRELEELDRRGVEHSLEPAPGWPYPVVTRAGQYMRRLRRLENERRHRG